MYPFYSGKRTDPHWKGELVQDVQVVLGVVDLYYVAPSACFSFSLRNLIPNIILRFIIYNRSLINVFFFQIEFQSNNQEPKENRI